ncbi:MAG: cbb3-type cytochrome c oxidase N-terminal domain-containing protein [Polyangiaceae bacterium]
MSTKQEETPPPSGEGQVVHEVDGIQEYDNKLPNWWLMSLFGTIAFAVGYWYTYEIGHFEQSPFESYQAEHDKSLAEEAAKSGSVSAELLQSYARSPDKLASARETFISTCAQCHKEDGSGGVGPNLTDKTWIHGGKPLEIHKTISEGVPGKMPAWGSQLGAEKTKLLAAYVISLKGTNVPGKAPEGKPED